MKQVSVRSRIHSFPFLHTLQPGSSDQTPACLINYHWRNLALTKALAINLQDLQLGVQLRNGGSCKDKDLVSLDFSPWSVTMRMVANWTYNNPTVKKATCKQHIAFLAKDSLPNRRCNAKQNYITSAGRQTNKDMDTV